MPEVPGDGVQTIGKAVARQSEQGTEVPHSGLLSLGIRGRFVSDC